jgi:chromosome partition protein MukE
MANAQGETGLMESTRFVKLGDVVADDDFPDVDLALRRGRHVDREDEAWYAFLSDAQEQLEAFYARFGCELIHRTDGYFYLLPTGDKLGRRHLSVPEMLVGQALTLLYLDPATVQNGGLVTREDVLGHLAAVMGTDALMHALNPTKKKRVDERVAQEAVRHRVGEAIRKLSLLGFVELVESDRLRLRSALLRFAEPVRGEDSPAEALQALVARGEVLLGEAESFSGGDAAREADDLPDEVGDETPSDPEAASFDDDFDSEQVLAREMPASDTDEEPEEPATDFSIAEGYGDFEDLSEVPELPPAEEPAEPVAAAGRDGEDADLALFVDDADEWAPDDEPGSESDAEGPDSGGALSDAPSDEGALEAAVGEASTAEPVEPSDAQAAEFDTDGAEEELDGASP